jgi:hypothetical protein
MVAVNEVFWRWEVLRVRVSLPIYKSIFSMREIFVGFCSQIFTPTLQQKNWTIAILLLLGK